jgi:hypothetical protein
VVIPRRLTRFSVPLRLKPLLLGDPGITFFRMKQKRGALREGRLFCLWVWGLAQNSVSLPRLNEIVNLIIKGGMT